MYLARGIGSARLTTGAARTGAWFRVKPKIKIQFFDRNVIKTRWPAFNKDPLLHAGNLVMKIARGSIKRRSYRMTSPPGHPPFSHADTPNTKYGKAKHGKKGRRIARTPPFKQIFSLPNYFGPSVANVIVGMVGYTRTSHPVPGLHEHGGTVRRKVFQNLGQRRLKTGQYGKNNIRFGPKMVRYPERAFMMPALMKARQRLPRLWLNSISRSGMPA